jgi:hypothetical protein
MIIIDLGLWYLKKKSEFSLINYLDADFVECNVYRKCTSEICYFLGSSLV